MSQDPRTVCTYEYLMGQQMWGSVGVCSAVPSPFNHPVRLTLALEPLCIFTGTFCCPLTMVMEVYIKTSLLLIPT